MRRRKLTISRVFVYIFLVLVAISTVYPFIFMLFSSFKDKFEYLKNMFGLPAAIDFSNFQSIFKIFNIPQLLTNSFIITVSAVIITLLVDSMAAFSMSKLHFRGRDSIFRLMMFVLLVPAQALMMPIYIIVSKMGLVNSHLGIILIHVATSVAFSTYLLYQNCQDIPDEIVEAARIDGAGYPNIYMRIIVPMLSPTLATLGILNFLAYWNEVVYSRLILQKVEMQTMTLGLMTLQGKYGTNMPLMMSGLMVNLIPALMIFLIFNKYLSKGIAMGSGK